MDTPPLPTMPTPRSEISFNTRLALLATCIALIIALQLPVIQRTFSAAVSPSTLSTNTTLGWERDPQHPRYRLFTALLSYVDYKANSKAQLHRKLQGYKRLTPWSKKVPLPHLPTSQHTQLMSAPAYAPRELHGEIE